MAGNEPSSYDNSQYDSSLEAETTVVSQAADSSSYTRADASTRVSRLNLFSFNGRALLITGAALLFVVLTGVGALVFSGKNSADKQATNGGVNYSVGSLSVKGADASKAALQINDADHLQINGQLIVTKGVVLAPSAQPTTGTAGQIYYDQNTNQPYYYNGTQFVSLAPTPESAHVTSIGGASGIVNLGTGLQLIKGQLSLSSSALASLASSGVASIKSAAANVSITADAAGNYTLSGNLLAGNGSTGQIALFTGGNTLAGSILSQSGTVVNVAGGLSVSGTLDLPSNTITVGGITFNLPTTGPATQTICTTSISCAGGGGTAVTLNPAAPQTAVGATSAIAINETGGASLLQLQSNGSDKFVVSNNGNLSVAGTTTLGSTLSVTGATNLQSNLGVAGNAAVSGTLGVTGVTTLSGSLNAQSTSTFGGLATFNAGLTVASSAVSITGGSLSVDATSSVRFANLGAGLVQSDASGNLSSSAVDRNSASLLSGTLNVGNGGTGATSFTGNGIVYGNGSGALQSTAAGTSGQILVAGALGAPNFVSVTGDVGLAASGAASVTGLNGTPLSYSTLTSGQVLTYNGTNWVNALITNANLQAGTFANITGTGALTSGSIGSGFGTISTTNAITTTAALQGATVTATGAITGASVTASGAVQGATLAVSGFTVNGSGAITGVTGITTTGGYTQSGSGTNSFSGDTSFSGNLSQTGNKTFSTGTGAVSLNGNTSVGSGLTFTTNGTTTFNGSTSVSGSNTFSVGTGATTLGGTLGVTGAATFANNIAVQGGNVTIGATGVNGTISLTNSTNTNLSSLVALAPSGSGTATYQLPSIAGGASDVICTVGLGNCAGSGTGVTHGTATAGYIPYFETGNKISNSYLFQAINAGVGSFGINTATPGAYVLNVQGGDVNFSGAATIGSGLNVTGASAFSGNVSIGGSNTLTVGGNTTLSGTLNVSGASTLAALSATSGSFSSNVSVTGTLGVTGNTTLSTLSTSGNASVGGALSVTGATTLAGLSATTASFSGNTTVGGTLGVTGATTLNVTTVNGAFNATNGATVSGATSITGTTDINTTGTATTTIGNSSANVVISSNGLKVTAAGAVSGVTTLSVSGAISGATAVNTINGLIINSGALSGITGLTTSGGYTQSGTNANTFSGATTFSGAGTALTVNNDATITGTASVGTLSAGAGGISTSGTLTVTSTSASSIDGTLNLTGTGTGLSVTNNATIGGSLAIQGANALTLGTSGSGGNTGSLQLANTTNSYYGVIQAAAPDTSSTTGNSIYVLPSTVAGTTSEICVKEANNCGASSSTVTTTSDGVTNTLAKFTGAHTLANSSISDDGTTVSVAAALQANSLSTNTIQSSGNLTITPSGSITIGATNQITAIQGNSSSTITVSASGHTTTIGFTAPTTTNNTITFPAATGTVCLSSNNCNFATAGSGVTSVDSLTGALTIANSTGLGSTITINNAKADSSTKGIATFDGNFSDNGSGLISTVQGITTTSSVQFAGLTLSGNLTLGNSGVVTANTFHGTGSGDISFDALTHTITFTTDNGANSFVFPSYGGQGQVICTSGISCATGGGTAVVLEPSAVQTASSNRTALFINKTAGSGNIMQLQAGGSDAVIVDASGNTTLNNTTTIASLQTNSITPTASLTVGATSQAFTLQGTANSAIKTTDGGFNTTIGFNIGSGGTAPTGAVNYQFVNDSTVAPGTYNVCTTAGNCAGVGGSVTTTGGTAGKLAYFTSAGNIDNSIVTQNSSSLITIGGNLAVGVSGSASLTLGVASTQSGSLVFKNSTNGNTITLVNPSTAVTGNTTISLPNASGTIAVSASGPITLDPLTGQISCASCLTSGGGSGGGVSSITGTTSGSSAINGALTINNALTSGSAITIDNAKADGTTKGIAAFNSSNFTDASGVINTIQDITTTSAVTFNDLTLQGTSGLTVGSASNIGQLAFKDGTADGYKATFSPMTLTANRTITIPNNGGTLAVAATGNIALSAGGVISITNSPTFTGTITAPALTSSGALNITSGGQLSIGGTGQQLSLLGSTSSTLAITGVSGTTTVSFASPSTNRAIQFPDAAGTVCLSTNNCNFATGGSGVTSLNGLNGALNVANASGSGSTITIDTATTTGTKGIASFNSTNFSISSGVVNTIQDIATTSTPSFGGITINGATQLNGTVTVADTYAVNIGTGGLSVTGSTNLAATTVTGATDINTTGTAATTIGNNAAALTIASTGLKVTSAGATSGITTLAVSGAISGATATNTINGLIINGGALSGITGYTQASGNFDASGSSGTFKTSTGAVSLSGATTVTGTNTFTVNGGLASFGAGVTATAGNITASAGAIGAFNNVTATNNTALLGQVGPSNETGIQFSAGTYDTKLYRSAANALLTPGSLNVQGSLSLGTNNSTAGTLVFNTASSTKTVSITATTPTFAGNVSLSYPAVNIAADEICLKTTANCAGSGGGITGTGTQNYVTKYNNAGGTTIGVSQLFDDGTFVGVNTTTNLGQLSVVASGTASTLYLQGAATGAAPVSIVRSGGSTGDLLQFQNSSASVLTKVNSSGDIVFSHGSNGVLSSITQSGISTKINFGDGSGYSFAIHGNTTDILTVTDNSGVAINSFPLTVTANQNVVTFTNGTGSSSPIEVLKQFHVTNTSDFFQLQSSSNTVLAGADVNGNLYLNAGQSLKINGSTSFPSSPTEGQIYFRTDNKQLYVYENGKWVAQGGGSTTYVVAASNSVNKEKADFVGNGTADDVAINAAISALPSTGGQIILLDGTYNITANVTLNKLNTTLTGLGKNTILKRMYDEAGAQGPAIGGGVINIYNSSQSISNLTIDGNKATYTSVNDHGIGLNNLRDNILLNNLTITNSAGQGIRDEYNSLNGGTSGTGKNVLITNNYVYSNNDTGIYVSGTGAPQPATVSNNTVNSNGAGGFSVGNATVMNNIVNGNTGTGIGTGSAMVTGNTITNNTGYGLSGGGGTWSGNIISSNGGGGMYLTRDNTVINGNTITSNTYVGIYFQSNYNVVTNNRFANNASGEIASNGDNYERISDNYLTVSAGQIGIALQGASNSITSNTINGAGTGTGISLASSATNIYLGANSISSFTTQINDAGKNTQYADQADANGNMILRGSAGVGINTLSPTTSLQNAGGFSNVGLSTPGAPTVTNQGTAGSTSYTYAVTAYDGIGETLASTGTTTATGAATLNSTNFNRITPSRVSGAVSYKIYRTASGGTPSSTGLIGTVAGGAANFYLDDTGLAASGSAPAANTTGSATIATFLGINNASPANRLAVNGITTSNANTQVAQALIGTGSAAGIGLVIQGSAGQSADLFQIQRSDGYAFVRAYMGGGVGTVSVDGTFNGNSLIASGAVSNVSLGQLTVYPASAAAIGQVTRAFTGQTADLQQFQNSAGAVISRFDANGNLVIVMNPPTTSGISTNTTGGTLAANTYYYKVTALDKAGNETTPSTELSQVTTGSTSTVTITGIASAGASSYRIYRGTASNGENTYFTITGGSQFTDTGAAGTAGSVPTVNNAKFTNLSAISSSFAGANATASGSFAAGSGSLASGTTSVALGSSSTASGSGSFAVGGATASGAGATAIGTSVTIASGTNSVAIGDRAVAAATESIQLGVSTGPGNNPTNNTKYSLQFGTSQLGNNTLFARGGGSYNGAGTVSTTSGAATVTGVGTTFTNDFIQGDRITVNGETFIVLTITNDTTMTVNGNFTNTNSGVAYTVLPAIFKLQGSTGTPNLFVSDRGYLGVGQTTSVYNNNNQLDVESGANNNVARFASSTSGLSVVSNGTAVQLQTDGTGSLLLQTASGGNVGIGGVTTPGARLQVNTGAAGNIGQIIQGAASQTADLQQFQSSTGAVVSRFDASGNLVIALSTPPTPSISTSTTGGSLAANTYYYKVTALDANGGETTPSTEVSVTTTGATSSNVIGGTTNYSVVGAVSYRIYRGTSAGSENVYYTTANSNFTDTGAGATAGAPPTTNNGKFTSLNGTTTTFGGGKATGTNSFAAGQNSSATGANAVAIGQNATASNGQAIAIGNNANATGSNSISLGQNTTASGTSSYAFGYNANASSQFSTALGYGAATPIKFSTAIGSSAYFRGGSLGSVGTVSTTAGSAVVTGSGTTFQTDFIVGDRITIGAESYSVISIASDTSLTVATNFSTTNAGTTYTAEATVFRLQSNGNTQLLLTNQGDLGLGTTNPGARLQINTRSASSVGQIIQASASQSADLLQVQNSSGSVLAKIDATGNLTAATVSAGKFFAPGNDFGAMLNLQSNTGSTIGIVVKAFGGVQTADLLQLRDGGGNSLAKFTANGQLTLGGVSSGSQLGQLSFADGTNNGFTATISLNGATLPSSQTFVLPTTGGTLCTIATCTGAAGGSGNGNYIQNGATLQSGATFYIQSSATNVTTGVLKQFASQTADILKVEASGSTTALSGFDANGNLYVAAGQSLKVNGSTSFPSSPTEGQIYFRTDNKQLYVYENGKWTAQGGGSTTYTVAASNSVNKEKADYIGNGTADDVAINAAISALPSTGGQIILLDGTYNITASVNVNKASTTISGQGNSTILKRMYNESADGGILNISSNSDTITQLYFDGNKATYSNSFNHGIYSAENCNSYNRNKIISNTVVNPAGTGIYLNSGACFTGTNQTITNNRISGAGVYGMSLPYLQYGIVTGNNISGSGSHGLIPQGAGHSIFSDNVINGNGGNGIQIGASSSNTVEDNIITSNTGFGIGLGFGNSELILGNKITSNAQGINVAASENYDIISNNLIASNTSYGINVASASASNNTFSGNTFPASNGTNFSDASTTSVYTSQVDNNGNMIMKSLAGTGINVTPTASLQNAGGFINSALSTPGAPTVTNQGTAGSTSYTYAVTAYDGLGETLASAGTTTATGAATLNGTNYNQITPARVSGAVSYKIYRTASGGTPSTTGLIGTLAGGGASAFNDTGIAASGSTPAANTTGGGYFQGNVGIGVAPNGTTSLKVTTPAASGVIAISASSTFGTAVSASTDSGTGVLASSTGTGIALQAGSASGISGLFQSTNGVGSNTSATLVSKLAVSQTADLLQLQNSSSTVLSRFDATGGLAVGAYGAPSLAVPSTSTTGGGIAAGTYYFQVYAGDAFGGYSPASNEQSITTTGATSTIGLSWSSITGASQYFVYYGTTPGGENKYSQLVQTSTTITLTSLPATSGSPSAATGGAVHLSTTGDISATTYQTQQNKTQLNAAGLSAASAIGITAGQGVNLNGGSQTVTVAASSGVTALTVNGTTSGIGQIIKANATTPGDLLQLQASGGAVLSRFDSAGNLAIGTAITPFAPLTVNGSIPSAATATVGLPNSVRGTFVAGRYTYVTTSAQLKIYDVSNPASPTAVSSTNYPNTPTDSYSVVVAGRYAYAAVVSSGANYIYTYDVSNPTSPSLVNTVNLASNQTIQSLQISGHYLYADYYLTGTSFVAFDLSNPAAPSLVGGVNTTNNAFFSFVSGQYAYILDGTIFRVVSISNPAAMSSVGTVSMGTAMSSVYVQGRYAYVVGNDSLQIIDVSNPASPSLVGSAFSLGASSGPRYLSLQGRYAYIGLWGSNLISVVDISNPSAPSQVGTFSSSSSNQLVASGRYLYVVGNSQLRIYAIGGGYLQVAESGDLETTTLQVLSSATINDLQVSNGLNVGGSTQLSGSLSVYGSSRVTSNAAATVAQVIQGASGQTADLFQLQNNGGSTVAKFDANGGLTIAANTNVLASVAGNGTAATSGLTVTGQKGGNTSGTTGQIAGAGAGLSLTGGAGGDAASGSTNGSGGAITLQGGAPGAGAGTAGTYGNILLQGTGGNVGIGTMSPFAQLTVAGKLPTAATGTISTNLNGPHGIAAQGNYLFVVNNAGGTLTSFDVTRPGTPAALGSVATGPSSAPTGIAVSGKYAYVTYSGTNSLGIFDISNPSSMTSVATIGVGTAPYSVAVSGRYVYVANPNSSNMSVVDVSNPAAPVVVNTYAFGVNVYGITVAGKYLYAGGYTGNRLYVIDISNPTSPTAVGNSPATLDSPIAVAASGRYVYAVNYNGTGSSVSAVDVSNPASPTVASTVSTGGNNARNISIQGRYAYVTNFASSSNTVVVIDISNPTSLTSVGTFSTDTGPFGVAVVGRYAYVTAYNTGSLKSYDIGGSYTQALEVGSVDAGTLSVRGSSSIGGDLAVQSSINVMGTAQLNNGLSVLGATKLTANAASTIAQVVQGASGQTADLLQLQNNSGTVLSRIDANGSVIVNLGIPPTPSISTSTTGGTLAAATYYYKVTALDAAGNESTPSAEVSITTTGATSSNIIGATTSYAVTGAKSYRIYRGTSAGGENVYYTTTATNFTDTNGASTGGSVPTVNNAKAANITSTNTSFNGGSATNGSFAVQGIASGANSFSAGPGANATASGSVAIGNIANATASNAIAIGSGATASGAQSFAIGSRATASGAGAIAIQGSGTGGVAFMNNQVNNSLLYGTSSGGLGTLYARGGGSYTASGTVATTNGSPTLTGTSTTFQNDLIVGDRITVNSVTYTVTAIASQTSLTLSANAGSTASGLSMTILPAIFKLQDSTGAAQVFVNDQGYLGLGTTAPTATLDVRGSQYFQQATGVNSTTLTIQANSAQNAGNGRVLEIKDSSGNVKTAIDAYGNVFNVETYSGDFANADGAAVNSSKTYGDAVKGIVVRGNSTTGSYTQTADLFEAQSWNGTTATNLFTIGASGATAIKTTQASAFNIQNAASSNTIFNVNTSTPAVTIGSATATALNITGSQNLTGTIAVTGSADTLTASIQGFSGQSADLLNVKTNGATNPQFAVSGTGALTLRSDNSAIFTIMNAAATTTVLTVNTTTTGASLIIGTSSNGVSFAANGAANAYELTLAGTARHQKSILLTAEYAGGVLSTTGDSAGRVNASNGVASNCTTTNTGTMTAGLDTGVTGFGNTNVTYYNWTSADTTNKNCYDVVVQVPVPSDFDSWNGNNPITAQTYTDSTANTDLHFELRNTTGGGSAVTNYDYVSILPGTAGQWTNINLSGTIDSSTNYTPGSYFTIRIRMSAKNNANVRIGNITLNYKSKY